MEVLDIIGNTYNSIWPDIQGYGISSSVLAS